MNDRSTWFAAVFVGILAVVGVILTWPSIDATPAPAAPAVSRTRKAASPRGPRVYELQPPPGWEAPPSRPEAEHVPMDPEETQAFQRAAMRASGLAEAQCLEPWAQRTPAVDADQPEAEVVMDTILDDGVVVDVRLRGLVDLPPDVLDCIRDVAWATDWPEADSSGQLVFQHTLTARLAP